MRRTFDVTLKSLKMILFVIFCTFPFVLTGILGKISEFVDSDLLIALGIIPLILIAETSILLLPSEKYLANNIFAYALYEDANAKKQKYKYFFIALLCFDFIMFFVTLFGAFIALKLSCHIALKVFLFSVPLYFAIRIYRCARRLKLTIDLIKSERACDEKWKSICKDLENILYSIDDDDEFFNHDVICNKSLNEIDIELRKRFSTITYICDLPKSLKTLVFSAMQAKTERYLKTIFSIDE